MNRRLGNRDRGADPEPLARIQYTLTTMAAAITGLIAITAGFVLQSLDEKNWLVQPIFQASFMLAAWESAITPAFLGLLTISTLLVAMVVFGLLEIQRVFWASRREFEEIYLKAYTDPVCGLANKPAFEDAIRAEVGAVPPRPCAIMMMDLAKFKAINDVHGHQAGDKVLKIVGERLAGTVGNQALVGRLGGDEFAVLLKNESGLMRCIDCCEDVVAAIDEPIIVDGKSLFTTTAVGIARFPHDGDQPQQLINRADMAMYLAKTSDEYNWCFYDSRLAKQSEESEQMALDIRDGLKRQEFDVVFQPQYRLIDDQLSGFEALLCWQHPKKGWLKPKDFFPSASEHGLIIPLQQFTIARALKIHKRWNKKRKNNTCISLNICNEQFNDAEHIYWFEREIRKYNFDMTRIIIEVSENCLIGRGTDEVPNILENWSAAGISICLDDFGTGFASLSHLKDLPVDGFKIDQSFVHNIIYDDADQNIVSNLIQIGRALDLWMVATGVESDQHLEMLRRFNCPAVQGDFLCKPVSDRIAESLIGSKTNYWRQL